MPEPLRVALIGWGAINRRVSALLSEHGVRARVVAVGLRPQSASPTGLPDGAAVITDPAHLAAHRPDLVLEAAGRRALEVWAHAALAASPTLVCASTSAFTDDAFRDRLLALADERGVRVVLPAGAIGAVDAIRAAAFLSVETLTHEIRKPPAAWKGTAAEEVTDLDALEAPFTLFEGSAREAAQRYPQNANATATSALAGLGLDATRVRLIAEPGLTRNVHVIALSGAVGEMTISLTNTPSPLNPKSSEMTALSLVRIIANAAGPLVI